MKWPAITALALLFCGALGGEALAATVNAVQAGEPNVTDGYTEALDLGALEVSVPAPHYGPR